MARLELTYVNIDASDPRALARFYAGLLGWEVAREKEDYVVLRASDGGRGLAFQLERSYSRPRWPSVPGGQQMMMHLEIKVDDLAAGVAHAVSLGAAVAEFQPQDDVRVCLDPDGHPFCLYI